MSLTNHLRTPGSPVRAYLDGVSPWLADTQGRSHEALSTAQALGLAGLASSRTIVPPRPDVNAARSGTAVDFRARVALGGFDPHGSVAAQGVALLPLYADELDNGRHRVSVLSEAFDVAARILDASSEDVELDRACLLLACCEQVYRAGAQALAGSLGDALDAAEDGLAFALGIDGSALADLRALMEANVSQLVAWRDRIAAGERFEPNPSFAGSALVGGADADWIVGDTLIDSKAYAKLTVPALRGFLRQLLGYVMLDLDDALGIRRVGIWLPRQGLTKSWSLDRLLGGDSDELLPKLRDGFRNATESTQLAVREQVTQRRKHQILAENKHTPRRMLVDLALSDDVDIRFRVGQNAVTPEETVRALARDRYAKAREGVARNERAPIDVLEELSQDRSIRVRRAVAANPHAPKGRAKAIAVGRAEQHRPQRDALMEAVLVPAGLADDPLQIHQDRDDDALDTKWFDDFLTVALGGGLWGHGSRLPVPKSSMRWARQEDRSLDVPNWLAAGLPDAVRADLMREHRPAWVRRRVAQSLPISDPAVRDRLLSDPDPEIRWSALRRSVSWPDDALAGLLGRLAGERKERTRFRLDGDDRAAWERTYSPAEQDRETLALVAAHPSTPQVALTELLGSKTPDVLVALAENPVLPAEDLAALLPRLTAIRSHEIRERLAASPNVPAPAALALAQDRDLGVRLALARNRAVPPEALDALAEDREPTVRLAVAVNTSAPAEIATAIVASLLVAAADEDLQAALRAADGRDDLEVPAELIADALERLSKSRMREPDLRRVAAGDSRARASTLTRLARSAEDSVRSAVARNPSAPADSLAALAADAVSCVRASAAANESLDPAVLAALVHDQAPDVRASVAGNSRIDDPALLKDLLRDDDRGVRSAAYWNPSTSPEDKAEAEADRERAWREAAPSREDLEERVASKRAEVRLQVAYDSRTPPDILVLLGGERRSAQVRRAVAANPNTPTEALASLAVDKDAEVRQAVAFNSATPTTVLAEMTGRGVDLALLVALNPDAPIGILDSLAADPDPLVGCVAAGARATRAALAQGGASTRVLVAGASLEAE